MLEGLFDRYDFDNSGAINSKDEFIQLSTNAVVKLGLRIDIEKVTTKQTGSPSCVSRDDPMTSAVVSGTGDGDY